MILQQLNIALTVDHGVCKMKKYYNTPEISIRKICFEEMLEENENNPLITGSGDENSGSQGSEFDGDLG